jgi:hypothetical protein
MLREDFDAHAQYAQQLRDMLERHRACSHAWLGADGCIVCGLPLEHIEGAMERIAATPLPARAEQTRELKAMMVVGLHGAAREVGKRGGRQSEYTTVVLDAYDRAAARGQTQSDTREQRRQLACHVWDATYGART